jgi:hypothetical protein
MATGLGKTVVFSQIPRRGRMLILSHREELVNQPRKFFDCPFGVEKALARSWGQEVVSASVQSLVRRLPRFFPNDFDVIVTDEAHHATAATYRKIYGHFKPRLHVGFTATPNRADGVGLEHVFEDIVFERDLKWGIENGWLCPIYCLRANLELDLRSVAVKMGDYSVGELDKAVNITGANKAVAEVYEKYATGPTLIFCVSVDHARAVAKEIKGAVAIVGGEERKEALRSFRDGETKVLTNCMVFTEGTDLPNIETVIIARPTKNLSLYTQMVGRGTRLHEGKKRLTLIDCAGNDPDICAAPSLLGLDLKIIGEKKIEGDLFDIPEIISREWDQPKYWIKNVEYVNLWARARKLNMHGVNYFRRPDGTMFLSTPRLRVKIPPEDSLGKTVWNNEKVPTQKVLDEIYASLRAHCADDRALWDMSQVKQWGAFQASEKQRALVARFWPDAPEDLTKLEANQVLTRGFCL